MEGEEEEGMSFLEEEERGETREERGMSMVEEATSFIQEDEYLDNIEEARTVRQLPKEKDDQRIK